MQVLTYLESTTVNEAIKLLDLNGNGILPVIKPNNKFLGIITDGDIRKAILNNNLKLNSIINNSPHLLSSNSTKYERINFLKKIKRRHLPLINDDETFADVFTLDSVEFNSYPNWVIIMAGGLGSRLGTLTENTPKPMLKLDRKPILEHIINSFIHHGFRNFVFCLNYKGELIKQYFKNGEKWGVNIKYIEEKKRLGTGGALGLIKTHFKSPLIVTNGDVLTSHNFEMLLNYHKNSSSLATMCIREMNNKIPYGLIKFDSENNILELKEKPQENIHINTGIYILEPCTLNFIPKNEFFDLPSLFKILIQKNKNVKAYNLSDYWVDIGSPEQYMSLKKEFKKILEK